MADQAYGKGSCQGSAWVAFQHSSRSLMEAALELQHQITIPGTVMDWLNPGPWASVSAGAESVLHAFEEELSAIHAQVVAAESELAAGVASLLVLPETAQERLAEIESALAAYKPELLAREARRVLLRSSGRCAALTSRVRSLQGVTFDQTSEKVRTPDKAEPLPEKVGTPAVLDLSKEQEEVTTCPHSVFVQGRSGTGKTLALVRRLLHRRNKVPKGVPTPTQLFVTKSSILCDEVTSQLQYAGCSPGSWPPRDGDVLCVTWDNLASLLVPQDQLVVDGAAINFERFLRSYWPHIRLPHLPAQLVWAEFTTRLRPFGSVTKMTWTKRERVPSVESGEEAMAMAAKSCSSFAVVSGLSLSDYLKEDLSAVGVRLTVPDQQRIHDMFVRYTKMKKAQRELDDTDVAARVAREVGHVGVNARLAADAEDDIKRKRCKPAVKVDNSFVHTVCNDTFSDVDDPKSRKRGLKKRGRKIASRALSDNVDVKEKDTKHSEHQPSNQNKAAFETAFSGVGELYVDEAQDFSPAELTVLFSLCHDPDGVAVAGDTCQTINPGSAFSFADIVKAFCDLWASSDDSETEDHYQGKKKGAKAQRRERIRAARKACGARAKNACRLTLRYNYRCAAGVAHLAGSVTQLLLNRFPQSADRIDEEVAMHRSVKLPVYAELPSGDPSMYLLGSGAQRATSVDPSRIAVLVRDRAARAALRAKGVLGTILTVVESKGLEFDLVVLVGFLSSAVPDSQIWSIADDRSEMTRVVRLIEDAQQLLYGRTSTTRLTEQDRSTLYHAVQGILELKMLYVAISRAKAGFALLECMDGSPPWSALLESWEVRGLMDVWQGLQSYTLGVNSSLEGLEHGTAKSLEDDELVGNTDPNKATEDGKDDCEKEELEEHISPQESDLGKLNSETLAIPALPPALEIRFCTDNRNGGLLATAVQAHGMRLLRHAEDNPRDRWGVFSEAIAALSQAAVMVDQELFDALMNLQQNSFKHGGVAAEISESRVISAVPNQLHASQEESVREMPQSLGMLSMQMCVILQEASREPCRGRHPSGFNKLRKLAMWERIFSFVVSDEEADVHNTLNLVAEYVHEHDRLHYCIQSHISLARAWQTFGQAMFDADGRSQEHSLVNAAHEALAEECEERLAEAQDEQLALLDTQDANTAAGQQGLDKSLAEFSRQEAARRKRIHFSGEDSATKTIDNAHSSASEQDLRGNSDELSRWMSRAAEHLMELHPLIMIRASKCATAARKFLAVGHADLAAKAFTEASTACTLVRDVAKGHAPAGDELLAGNNPVALAVQAAERKGCQLAKIAAGCWILPTTNNSGRQVDYKLFWSRAQNLFTSVGYFGEAAICAMRAGNFSPQDVLDSFLGSMGSTGHDRSLVWLCAALIGGL